MVSFPLNNTALSRDKESCQTEEQQSDPIKAPFKNSISAKKVHFLASKHTPVYDVERKKATRQKTKKKPAQNLSNHHKSISYNITLRLQHNLRKVGRRFTM